MQAEAQLQGVLKHIPKVEIAFDGDSRQALGLDLCVAVINLAHRTDKWQTVKRRMASIGLDKLIRVPAVVGKELSPAQINAVLGPYPVDVNAPPQSHFTLTPPAIGCFLSHLAIWHWMLASGVPRVLIFEDDANPVPGFDADRFRRLLSSLPADAGMVFVGRIIMNGMAERPGDAELARLYYFNGTFAYLVTPAACHALVPGLVPPRIHVDHQMSQALIEQRNDFKAYYPEPAFFEPDWSLYSDCYVPLTQESDADRELGAVLASSRKRLADEGRPLLAPPG